MKLSKIIHFAVTDSTFMQAKMAWEELTPEHCILISADEQTEGQGTRNREWASPPQVNIYATYAYLTDTKNDRYLINITQVAAFSVVEVLQEYGLKPSFKWANDVLLNGKKICGILAKAEERSLADVRYRAIAIGIGLNVNMLEQDLHKAHLKEQVTSMRMSTGQTYDKNEVLKRLSDTLLKNIQLLYTQGFSYFVAKIAPILETFNGELQWFDVKDEENKHQIVMGSIVGINEQGYLQLSIHGQVKEFFFGRLLKDDEINQAREPI